MNKKKFLLILTLLISLFAMAVLSACGYIGNSGQENTDYNGTGAENGNEQAGGVMEIQITVNNTTFDAQLYDNASSRKLYSMLPLELNMSAMAHEKYYNFADTFPVNSSRVNRIEAGDIMLWGDNCLVIFYEGFSTSYSYTRLGKIQNTEGLAETLGSGIVNLTISAAENTNN